ncbi:restriction endonuclease subunit S [Burkholderia semiarida]|uniref:Restriction endonuclease subunit S n=1 Tax=Burkholderia semiarida TaxID=2843303 RepID=A0ABW7L4R0_9BURK
MEVREFDATYLVRRHRTELGELPVDWRVVPIGELQHFITSGSRGWATYYSESGSTFLRITNLSRECIYPSLDDLRHVAIPPGDSEGIRTALEAGDILISITADIGIVGLVTPAIELPAYVNQHIALVRIADEKADARYLAYFLAGAASQRRFKAMTDAGAKAGMNLTGVRQVQVAFPPTVAEQQAIAEALSDADALVESLSLLLAKKRQLKQGAMQELLTGRRRLPGFTGSWRTKSLAALAKIQRGASPRPIDDPKWFDDSSQVGWVRISDVTQAGMHLESTVQRLSAAGIRHSRPVAAGSLIMSICATVGKPIITAIETCIHDGFVVFEDLQVEQRYLYYALLSIEQDWGRHGQSGSQMNLNTGLINRTEIAVAPTKEEQRAISQALADMDADIAVIESRLNKARDLKQGMMQELLTGRIRLVQPTSNAKLSRARFADDNIASTVAECRTLFNG